jgi:hypothetical protein
MLKKLDNAGWVAAFIGLCIIWGLILRQAHYSQKLAELAAKKGTMWVCPILGRCGPVDTPGLGTWTDPPIRRKH